MSTRAADARRTSVITGIGVVAPNGTGANAFWKQTQEGVSVLDLVSREGCENLPLKVAGEVRDFDPVAFIEERFLVQTDRFTHYAMAAADLALSDARLGRADYEGAPFKVGVVTAAGSGGGEFGQRELQRLWGRARATSVRTSPSPGSTRPAPVRSRSGAASRGRAPSWRATRPVAWTR